MRCTTWWALEQAGAGHGQIVAVIGEPGVGKTRLFHEFTQTSPHQGWLLLESSSASYGKATPYLPLLDLLTAYLQLEDRDDGRRIREKLTGRLLTLDPTFGPALPAFLALLEVPVDDVHWHTLEPLQRRQRILDALTHLFLRESQVQPLLLVFENLHWIDTETQAVLDSLVEHLPIFFPRMAAALGAAYTLAGRLADALPQLTQAMAQTTAVDRVGFQALCRLPLGAAQLLAGRLEEAQALAAQALALARAHQERGNEAYALRLLGDIAARREPPEVVQAEDYYRQALTLAAELGMRPLQAHCYRDLGMLYITVDQRVQAGTALATAIELYRAMDMAFWLPQAEAALAQVEG